MARRTDSRCKGCGDILSGFPGETHCSACNSPRVASARKAIRAAFRPEPETIRVRVSEEEHPMCEDAAHCSICREMLGMSPSLPGIG